MDVQRILLEEIPNREIDEDSLALSYAFGIVGSEKIDWARVNESIIKHRSRSALTRIKKKAWKRVEERGNA